jgi:hypothetical protein
MIRNEKVIVMLVLFIVLTMNSLNAKEVPQWGIFEILLSETIAGNLTPEDMTSRFWQEYCRGGYCTHGEKYMTVTPVEGAYSGTVEIKLPGSLWMAVRASKIN